jgi:magnesium transporter
MIIAYLPQNPFVSLIIEQSNFNRLKDALWVDVYAPTDDEINWIQTTLSIMVPTRAAMQEIEASSRLYTVHETLYMTATLIAGSTSSQPQDDSVTFILTHTQLLTLRYIQPKTFELFTIKVLKEMAPDTTALLLLIHLLEVTIDRLADIFEMVGANLEKFSRKIFNPSLSQAYTPSLNYAQLMLEVGLNANLSSKSRESLLTLDRLVSFFSQSALVTLNGNTLSHIDMLDKDIHSMTDYANFINNKINFLLDATLGLVNIEQNNIIKIFSVAAVIFLPPTLIASIYGMNFHMMPELDWKYGYLVAIGMMIASAIIPYQFFKRRKWL